MAVSGREYRWLILPIETKVRELDGKLLLAATAAERGWAVILGQVERIVGNTLHLPGVVLEKDGYFGNPRIGPFLASGKRVCALDEEGLVYLNSDDYCRRRLDRQNLHRLDRVFVWGQQQSHDILEHVSGLEDKLVLSGNPRFDLLRPELRAYYAPAAAQLNDHFGQFVLVNTNFADCNHFMGADWVIANLRNNRFITNAEQEANERAFMKYQRQILDHFVTLVRTLATSFPEHTIVVRPHPSEDHGTWREATSSLNNVTVIHEGDVNSWLLAAAVSIHNSCMTGIQGFLLERPTVAYEPVHSERFDYFLPNAVSSRAATTDEIATIVERHLKGPNSTTPKERSDRWKIAQRYLEGISGPLAADRIMDAMEGLEIDKAGYAPPGSSARLTASAGPRIRRLLDVGKGVARRFLGRGPGPRISLTDPRYVEYTRQKYPGINAAELQNKLTQFADVTGRFTDLDVLAWGSQAFCVLKL